MTHLITHLILWKIILRGHSVGITGEDDSFTFRTHRSNRFFQKRSWQFHMKAKTTVPRWITILVSRKLQDSAGASLIFRNAGKQKIQPNLHLQITVSNSFCIHQLTYIGCNLLIQNFMGQLDCVKTNSKIYFANLMCPTMIMIFIYGLCNFTEL